ncbi:HAUS augmin-like complex subunit 8 [Diadema antillarum]|uniref:HAUS augmin-like complex subunit 8 n=1 Tax=Diadema antillarum TaxID=105358 RepID=UPI003A8520CA
MGVNQMFALWKENEEVAKKRTQLELRLARLKHANELDQQLLVQEQGLGPLTSHLAQFKQEYSTLAHALDTTRHQVELTDILVPDDQDEFNDRLERELAESEALLGEIAAVTRTKQPKVEALSRAISMLETSVAQESAALLRCQELVAATSSLSNHETSMRIQRLEQRLEE